MCSAASTCVLAPANAGVAIVWIYPLPSSGVPSISQVSRPHQLRRGIAFVGSSVSCDRMTAPLTCKICVEGREMDHPANTDAPAVAAAKIDDIQILRGVAITMVLICHLSFSSTLLLALPVHLTLPFYVGVELFFVISGFVVTRSLIRGNYEPVSFLIRRCFRLYPPILAFLAISGAVNMIIRIGGWPPYAFDHLSVPFSSFARQAGAIFGGYLINFRTAHST